MAKENLKDEILNDEQLDEVAGGKWEDRRSLLIMFDSAYRKDLGSRGRIFEAEIDPETQMAIICAKAGVDYRQNAEEPDQFKINGVWRDAVWMKEHREETLKFFDKQLGIK